MSIQLFYPKALLDFGQPNGGWDFLAKGLKPNEAKSTPFHSFWGFHMAQPAFELRGIHYDCWIFGQPSWVVQKQISMLVPDGSDFFFRL